MRRLATLIVIPLGLAAGCGEGESVSDGDIVQALELKRSEDGGGYAVRGDAFCEVSDELLNDSSEVEEASDQDEFGLVISSSDENVGVQAVPPFDPECERDVKRGLDGLVED